MKFPETAEEPHFKLPSFKVKGKVMIVLQKGETHSLVFISENDAKKAVAEDSSVFEECWKGGKLTGVRVDLGKVSTKRLNELVEASWRSKAPKKLIADFDASR